MAAAMLVPNDFDEESPTWLSIDEVISRLRVEFGVVEVDRHRGRRDVLEQINFLKEQLERGHDPWNEYAAKLKHLELNQATAVFIRVTNDAKSKYAFIETVVISETPIFFGFANANHERAARNLVKRWANALDYEIED